MRGAPLGKKAEGKRSVADVIDGEALTIRDKAGRATPLTTPTASPTAAAAAAAAATPAQSSAPSPVQTPGPAPGLGLGTALRVEFEDGSLVGDARFEVGSEDSLAALRVAMGAGLGAALSDVGDWVFVMRGAPVGRKVRASRPPQPHSTAARGVGASPGAPGALATEC